MSVFLGSAHAFPLPNEILLVDWIHPFALRLSVEWQLKPKKRRNTFGLNIANDFDQWITITGEYARRKSRHYVANELIHTNIQIYTQTRTHASTHNE